MKSLFFLVPYYIMRIEDRPMNVVFTELIELFSCVVRFMKDKSNEVDQIIEMYGDEEIISSLKDKETGSFELAKAVKLIRMREGMSRKEFCDYTGIPYRTLQDWELGNRAIPPYMLRMLAYSVALRVFPYKKKNDQSDSGSEPKED